MPGFFSFQPEQLRAAREHADKSREQLALETDSTYPAISSYEAGNRTPSRATLLRLADALGVDVHDLVEQDPFVAESREAQGLPPTVEDPEALAKVAGLVQGGDRT